MQTIAQRKARINGWIKEYEKRIEQYKEKYGKDSRAGYLHIQLCKDKIRSWKQSLSVLTKEKQIDKTAVSKFIYAESCKYFGCNIKFPKDGKAGTLEKQPERYYISKILVDFGLICADSVIHLGCTTRAMYDRRNVLTKDKENKNAYRAYRITMESILEANKIVYK